MATYAKSASPNAPSYQPVGQDGAVQWNRVTVAATELTLNAVIPLMRLPRGALVHDVTMHISDLDTGAAGIVSVGVVGDTERYIRRASMQAAGTIRAGNDATAAASIIAAQPFTQETSIDLLVQTAPATAAAGVVHVAVMYNCE